MPRKRPRTSKSPRPTTTPLTVGGLGSVLVLYFENIHGMMCRERWMAKWAKTAATEIPIPKTREQFELALKAALNAGVFWGIDECRAILPKGLP
jgi:hypothetical protein